MSVSVSTHVLDTGNGVPAEGVKVELLQGGELLAAGETDGDGRIADLAGGLDAGTYSLAFYPSSPFFGRVELEVELVEGNYHIPLLVSPYACASYRGS